MMNVQNCMDFIGSNPMKLRIIQMDKFEIIIKIKDTTIVRKTTMIICIISININVQ